jgi:hypothetical protein
MKSNVLGSCEERKLESYQENHLDTELCLSNKKNRDFKYHDVRKIKKEREKEKKNKRKEKMENIRVLAISPKGRL